MPDAGEGDQEKGLLWAPRGLWWSYCEITGSWTRWTRVRWDRIRTHFLMLSKMEDNL